VPSLSSVAIRSSGGTKDPLSGSVTAFTKSTMARFGGVSFHEGNGSDARAAPAASKVVTTTAAAAGFRCMACSIVAECVLFTDYYGEQSCSSGRSDLAGRRHLALPQ
jgi:hypothetical protein